MSLLCYPGAASVEGKWYCYLVCTILTAQVSCTLMSWSLSRFFYVMDYISMAWCKAAVTPLHQQWSYCSLVLSHQFDQEDKIHNLKISSIEKYHIAIKHICSYNKQYVAYSSASKHLTVMNDICTHMYICIYKWFILPSKPSTCLRHGVYMSYIQYIW